MGVASTEHPVQPTDTRPPKHCADRPGGDGADAAEQPVEPDRDQRLGEDDAQAARHGERAERSLQLREPGVEARERLRGGDAALRREDAYVDPVQPALRERVRAGGSEVEHHRVRRDGALGVEHPLLDVAGGAREVCLALEFRAGKIFLRGGGGERGPRARGGRVQWGGTPPRRGGRLGVHDGVPGGGGVQCEARGGRVAGEGDRGEPVERGKLLEMLNRKLRVPELAIGNVNVLKDRTEFEVHKDSAKKVLMELKSLRVDDKKLKVEIVHRELPPISMQ